jgi:hypothetical protein
MFKEVFFLQWVRGPLYSAYYCYFVARPLGWRNLRNEEVHYSNSWLNSGIIQSKRVKWIGNSARMREK